MPSLAAPLAALLALACARAEVYRDDDVAVFLHNHRSVRNIGSRGPSGCLYEGRWFVEGAEVSPRAACLRCRCAHGALSCSRRACAALPDPPPPRCHVLRRRDACCPELHCPDGVTALEHNGIARIEDEDSASVATPASAAHACVEGGVVYAAGSAMSSRTACEQCFCLGGARRCVRPRCLPAPAGCRPRPAPGACCPQRYYCDRRPQTTRAPHRNRTAGPHDCEVEGAVVAEGERVPVAERASAASCARCFCLLGAVRCQPLACAPPLHGCTPLLRAGQCCPHQYLCDRRAHDSLPPSLLSISDNALVPAGGSDRSFRAPDPSGRETTTRIVTKSASATERPPTVTAEEDEPVSTTKVKRKTDDPPPRTTASHRPPENTTKTTTPPKTTKTTTTKATRTPAPSPTTSAPPTNTPTTVEPMEVSSTDQPEGSVKIIINGTINCTAELSSTLPNRTDIKDEDIMNSEAHARVPLGTGADVEVTTASPGAGDIITDRNVVGFDENETFTINVTSSLRTNTSLSTAAPFPPAAAETAAPSGPKEVLNISKKTKEDYDYDYTEPTLPPSLPNLKIIPFVAADAVVDEDVPPKETLTYPLLEREDKFPVYYPNVESKKTPFATRREDVYSPTQYPIFVAKKPEAAHFPSLSHTGSRPDASAAYLGISDLATSLREYTVSTSLGNHIAEATKGNTKPPITNTTFKMETPAVNLFSPPMETEGGFIPKGPGIIDEYYAVYPSTSPPVPHLTTSMLLETGKSDCTASDGRRVPDGESVSLSCSLCSCAWGQLHCAPSPCPSPPGCERRPASSSSGDLCCGDLFCDHDNKTAQAPALPTRKTEITLNETKVPVEIEERIPFDPPADRSEPSSSTPKTTQADEHRREHTTEAKITVSDAPPSSSTTEMSPTPSSVNQAFQEKTAPVLVSSESPQNTTTPTPMATTLATREQNDSSETKIQSQEYEDEEEDEGFSFGSVLKLLLSDSYDSTTTTTTASPFKKQQPGSTAAAAPTTTTPPTPMSTTKRIVPKPTIGPFVPMPHYPYIPPKKSLPQNTVNRIDHLVLGEATAIKKSTPRPVTTSFRPMTTPPKHFTTRTTRRTTTTARPGVTVDEQSERVPQVAQEGPQPPGSLPAPGGVGGVGGLLKLAGCNIYGQMYRVGRIIAELSTPCQECRCTELGVQCRALAC